MINEIRSKRYCSEDISIIENYHTAVADKEKKWEIHHRRECDDEGRTLLTHKQLIEMNLYYNRPAKELIFVTRSMHIKLHKKIYEKYRSMCWKKNSIPILQFTKNGTFIKEWPSARDAERQLGISQSHICHCLKGKRKSAGGFVWKYK